MSLLRIHPGDPGKKSRSLEIGPLGGAALAGFLLGSGGSIVLGLAGAPHVVSDAVNAADRRAIRETAQRGAESFASVGRRALALSSRLAADELFLARVGSILEVPLPDGFPAEPRDAAPRTPTAMESEAADLARRARIFELFRRRLAALPGPLPGGFDLVSVPARAPVEPSSSVPIELFGWHASEVTRGDEFCAGLTLASPAGTTVTAPAAGLVAYAGPVSRHADATWRRLGTIVVLVHDARTRTVYGHLAVSLVKKGQRVARGTPIGRVGTTGFAVAPRLHYEVHRLTNGRWVPRDPRIFILDVDWISPAGFRPGPNPPELPPLPISTR
jgi:murein DD-endopeptidase MepM/ murein hydrolase activator NlpD